MVDAGQQTPFMVIAEEQSRGKGQYQRQFASPPGGLYFSLVYQPFLPPERLSLTTLAVGLACCQELEKLVFPSLKLKWPNDIYLEGRKLAGILCETICDSSGATTVIIGVGVNVNSRREDFPEELHPTITTVRDATGRQYALENLAEDLAQAIFKVVGRLVDKQQDVLDEWQEHDYLCGTKVFYEQGDEVFSAIGLGLTDDGRYSVRDSSGNTHAILAGSLQPDRDSPPG